MPSWPVNETVQTRAGTRRGYHVRFVFASTSKSWRTIGTGDLELVCLQRPRRRLRVAWVPFCSKLIA
jgi:hypothetical protein